MRQLVRLFLPAILLLAIPLAHAHAQIAQKPATGVITGRVTLGDKGLHNVPVVLLSLERLQRMRGPAAKAVTDGEGRYKITNVAPGNYSVAPSAAAFVGPNDGMYGEMGRTVNIAEGETVENIDFALKRGGVITGRVMNADGEPVIGERIQLEYADKNERQRRGYSYINSFMYETDDRGVYRLFGLPAGRYTISVGESGSEGNVRLGFGQRAFYTRTFHPSATDESKATIIEVTEGSEITNADITLGRLEKAYSATGRVLDENGQPVANARVGNGALMKDQRAMGAVGFGSVSDDKGRFKIDGLPPGRYAAFVWNEGQSDNYTDPVMFEIVEGDVSGLELKLRRGASISGVAVIEGTTDRAVLDQLSQLTLWAMPEREERLFVPNFSPIKIAPDGTFRITGLQPGKVRIYLATYPPPKGFSMPRIERDGVTVREIDVARGAEVAGVRVVFHYGTGRVRGLVKIENGTLPAGARVMVSARRLNDSSGTNAPSARVDSRGSFLIEGLSTGEYELILHFSLVTEPARRFPTVRQKINVTSGMEVEATLTLDLNAKPAEGGNNE